MAETALYDPVIVEPTLTPQKITELVSFKRESAKLDYKLTFDISETTQKAEISKDIMAMANTAGGYIVIGIDNSCALVGCDPAVAERIDESIVRSQLAGYTSARIPIFVDNRVDHDGVRLVIITVLPVIRTLVVAEVDGNTPAGKPLFRKGDVLVRHGSASERWNQADVDFLLTRLIGTRKEEWLRDFGKDFRTLVEQSGGARPVVGSESYDLPAGDFQDVVVELLRDK